MSVPDASLEELEDILMVNSGVDFELHYDVTIRLVKIIRELQFRIEQEENHTHSRELQ